MLVKAQDRLASAKLLRGARVHLEQRLLSATSNFGFMILLWSTLDFAEFGLALAALMSAMAIAHICAAGAFSKQKFDGHLASQHHIANFHHAVGALMLRWLGAVAVAGVLWIGGALTLFADTPGLALTVLAAGPVFALVRLVGWHSGQMGRRSSLGTTAHWIMSICAASAAFYAGAQGATQMVGMPLICGLLLLGFQLRKLSNEGGGLALPTVHRPSRFGDTIAAVNSHADIVAVVIFLAAPAAASYLIVRVIVGLAGFALGQLANAARPQLSTFYRSGNLHAFRAAAARLNLGFLLIGGGIGLAILGAGQAVLPRLGSEASLAVVGWLLIGQLAPAIFGSSALAMVIAGSRLKLQMTTGAICLIAVLAAMAMPPSNPLELARLVATTQLVAALTNAIWVVRHLGIWPGITGVLYRQIKLT